MKELLLQGTGHAPALLPAACLLQNLPLAMCTLLKHGAMQRGSKSRPVTLSMLVPLPHGAPWITRWKSRVIRPGDCQGYCFFVYGADPDCIGMNSPAHLNQVDEV